MTKIPEYIGIVLFSITVGTMVILLNVMMWAIVIDIVRHW